MAQLPSRLAPWNPPVTSPAAYKPGMMVPERSITSARGLIRAQDFSWDKAARETLEVYQQVSPAQG